MPAGRPDPGRIINYTTTVSADKTIGEITGILRANGAKRISQTYEGQRIAAVEFALETPYGEQWYRLPARPQRVLVLLIAERNRGKRRYDRYYVDPESPPREMREQAERTAWRTVKDWIEVQFALVRAKQLEAAEVMLPYALVNVEGEETTVYQAFSEQRFKALGPGGAD